MAVAGVDAQLQSLIHSLQQPLASRIQVLESQARSYERMCVPFPHFHAIQNVYGYSP